MFICNPCCTVKKVSFVGLVSRGTCEFCEQPADCVDVHHSRIPRALKDVPHPRKEFVLKADPGLGKTILHGDLAPRREARKTDFMREGFWATDADSALPHPLPSPTPWPGQVQFLAQLATVEAEAKRTQYRGSSQCRCCGSRNGSASFNHKGWEWPSGFRHYVEAHNVRPSLAFEEFITGYQVR